MFMESSSLSRPLPATITSTSSTDTLSPELIFTPLTCTPYTQSFSPGINFGWPSLNPIDVSLAVASRRELLSMMSGIVRVGECEELMTKYILCPDFTLSPGSKLCSRTQSGGNVFTYPVSLTTISMPRCPSIFSASLRLLCLIFGTRIVSP